MENSVLAWLQWTVSAWPPRTNWSQTDNQFSWDRLCMRGGWGKSGIWTMSSLCIVAASVRGIQLRSMSYPIYDLISVKMRSAYRSQASYGQSMRGCQRRRLLRWSHSVVSRWSDCRGSSSNSHLLSRDQCSSLVSQTNSPRNLSNACSIDRCLCNDIATAADFREVAISAFAAPFPFSTGNLSSWWGRRWLIEWSLPKGGRESIRVIS